MPLGYKHSEATLIKMRVPHKGSGVYVRAKEWVPWNKNKKGLQVGWSKGKKLHYTVWNKGKKGVQSPYWLGKKRSEDTLVKMRNASTGKLKENARNWKSGRISTGRGYIMIYESNGEKTLYRLEHTVVMEKHIGRKLLEGENVHHKNGVRDDNRIENLELWTRPQPTGIRAKDALSWAEETVRKYKAIEDKI